MVRFAKMHRFYSSLYFLLLYYYYVLFISFNFEVILGDTELDNNWIYSYNARKTRSSTGQQGRHLCMYFGGCHGDGTPSPAPRPSPHAAGRSFLPPPPPLQFNGDYCFNVDFKERWITKGSGNKISVLQSKTKTGMNWFQAAACCNSKNRHLTNINSEADLKAYYDLLDGDFFIGWSDVHGFSLDWRNLKGKYPKGDMWHERNKISVTKGRCKEIGPRGDLHTGVGSTGKFYLNDMDCSTLPYIDQYVFCEADDPADTLFDYNCDNIIQKSILKSGGDQSRVYYETILKYNPNCERSGGAPPLGPPQPPPSTQSQPRPPKLRPLSDDDFAPSNGKVVWEEAMDKCYLSGLVAAAVETEEDNQYLNNNQRLKRKPYDENTRFWTAGKLLGNTFREAKLSWVPDGRLFYNHDAPNANGVNFRWTQPAIPDPARGVTCLDMRFPGKMPSQWTISDCNEKRHFICMRPPSERNPAHNVGSTPAKIYDDEPSKTETNLQAPPGLTNDDLAPSKGKATWQEARKICESSGLWLLVIEAQEDNDYLSSNPRLKARPYTASTAFWSAGRFSTIEYKNLFWKPASNEKTTKEFLNFQNNEANGIIKWWATGEPLDDLGDGKELCVDMKFPGRTPPVWSASNCWEKKHYICVRPTDQRREKGDSRFPPVKIVEPEAGQEDENPPATESNPITESHVAPSKGKLSWKDAKLKCEETGLHLLVIDSEEDNQFLSSSKRLKTSPYTKTTSFWSGGKFTDTEYTKLIWEPTKIEFKNFLAKRSPNGIVKWWRTGEPFDDGGQGTEVCIDMQFPGSESPPLWSASDCEDEKYYICVRPTKDRNANTAKKPIQIEDPKEPSKQPGKPSTPLSGAFIPDVTKKLHLGNLKPGMPELFTPLEPIDGIVRPTVGTFKAVKSPIKENPFSTRHGLMKPFTPIKGTAEFVPDQYVTGEFTPDKGSQVVDGDMTQDTPTLFLPSANPSPIHGETPGFWKPNVGVVFNYPSKVVHGKLLPGENGNPKDIVWKPDETTNGIFMPDNNPKKKIQGSMTQANIPVFTPHEAGEVLPSPTPGTWKPNPIKSPAHMAHGTMEPTGQDNNNFIPDEVIPGTFVPDKTSANANPIKGIMTVNPPQVFTPTDNTEIGQPVNGVWQPSDGSPTKPGTLKPDTNLPPECAWFQPKGSTPGQGWGPPSKPRQPGKPTNAKPYSPTLTGTFIPDATPKKLIRGTMKQDEPQLFTPQDISEAMKQSTPGTFKPDESPTTEWPFSTIHGTMKPSPTVKGSSTFLPDSSVYGEFTSDVGLQVFPGSMTQEDPSIFTPDSAPFITKPIPGTWRPYAGALPNHPCQAIHGTMRPVPGSETDAQFSPDSTSQGVFIPDSNPKKTIPGILTQTNPPEFIPSFPSELLKKPTSGTWKPRPLNPGSISHGTLKPKDKSTSIFVPDEVVAGKFVPDKDPSNPIEGYITKSVPQVFSSNDDTTDLSKPIPGNWKPNPGQKGVPPGNPKGNHGVLKPDSVNLPPNSAFFNPGAASPTGVGGDSDTPGKFYPDARPKVPIPGVMSKSPPYAFTPRNPTVDFNNDPGGTWVPDKPQDPNDPYEIMHGTIAQKDEGPVFIPDTLLDGVFIPDSSQIPIDGQLMMDSTPKIFKPKRPHEQIHKPTPGRWRPTKGSSPLYPYSTVHGSMKPSSSAPGSSTFTPDAVLEGEFQPGGNAPSIPGGMSQGTPTIFTPNDPIDVTYDTPGTWKPLSAISANHPFVAVHGSIRPCNNVDGGTQCYNFVPLDTVSGIFIPDDTPMKPITGTASQSNPSRFTPDKPSAMRNPVSGTWKPTESFIPDDPLLYTHCTISPPKTRLDPSSIFIPDVVSSGKFTADDDPTNVLFGTMTDGSRPVFKPESGDPIFSVIPGTWVPIDTKEPVRGTLTPPKPNMLPIIYLFFVPESGVASKPPRPPPIKNKPQYPNRPPPSYKPPAAQKPSQPKRPPVKTPYVKEKPGQEQPDEMSTFVSDDQEEDCDPNMDQLGPASKFYVGCKKAGV